MEMRAADAGRLSELLALTKECIIVPAQNPFGTPLSAVLNLGMKAGTKVKRPQAVVVSPDAGGVGRAKEFRDTMESVCLRNITPH